MLAQAYFERGKFLGDPIVRIFRNDECIADLPLNENSQEGADNALHRIKLYRKTKWERIEWGIQSHVYFKGRK